MKNDSGKKTLAIAVVATAIPVLMAETVLYFGLTFTSGKNIGFWLRVFLLFCCIFDFPAYIVAIQRSRIGAYWLVINVTVTALITIVFYTDSWAHSETVSINRDFIEFLTKAAVFLGLRLFSAILLLKIAKKADPEAESTNLSIYQRTASFGGSLFAITYCAIWGVYLFGTWWYMDRIR